MKTLMKILLIALIASTASYAKSKRFVVSFGDGGYSRYTVKDNICYGYLIQPKEKKMLMRAINRAMNLSIAKAKESYGKKANGFINIRFKMVNVGNDAVIYQVCGDIVKGR